MASPHLVEQVGRVLDGRYRVVAPIGTGASAAVFLADDVVLRRRVAIKVLHAALAADAGFLKRFQAEAHTAAALSSPNIMRVLDWGETDEGPFLVLEYLGGGSLRAVLDHSGTLAPEQAVSIGLHAARALEYAHRRGLVHRDIKPGNMLFDEEGRLAIADFGLARALAEAAWTEPGGAILGTARYAAPEQVRGQSLDGRADVYSLGLILIEAVCGYVPFTADTTIATLMGRLDAQLVAPPELGPLGPIVEKATNPDPEERLDASQLVALLKQAADELPAPAPLTLPGAVVVDVTAASGVDPTMLPGTAVQRASNDDAVPLLPPVPEKPRRRFFRGNRTPGSADVAQTTREAEQSLEADEGRSSKRRWKPSGMQVLAATAALLLIAVLSLGGYAWYFFTGREIAVPQLEGVSLAAARDAASTAEVKFSYAGEEYSETVPAGQTFDQSPEPGQTVHPRESVRVKVSKGPAPRAVPSVNGQMIDVARRALADQGFVVVTSDRYSETEPVGKVLDENPASGVFAKGTEVRLVLSSGPAPRTVPDLTGKTYEEAETVLAGLQLKVSRSEGFSDTVPAGKVGGTNPRPGASVPRGGTVAVVVSKGPDLVTVPDVTGKSITAANAALEAAGLKANVFGPAGGSVVVTRPAAGTKVKRDSGVNVYIG